MIKTLDAKLDQQINEWPVEARMFMHVDLMRLLDGYSNSSNVQVIDRPDGINLRRTIDSEAPTRHKRTWLSSWFKQDSEYVANVEDTVELHEYCVIYKTQYFYLVCGYDDVTDTLYVLRGSAFSV